MTPMRIDFSTSRRRFSKRCHALIKMAAFKMSTTFYRRVVIIARTQKDSKFFKSDLPIVFKRLGGNDLADYETFRRRRGKGRSRLRLTSQAECIVAQHEGRIVTSVWISRGRVYIPYLRRDIILQSNQAFIHELYTDPAYRGHTLAPAMYSHILQRYAAQGVEEFLAVIVFERANRLLYEKRGGKVYGNFSCLRLGWWQWDCQESFVNRPVQIVKPER